MTILFDINHPAHVHYFRNTIKKLKVEGHEVIVVSRNKEIEHELLRTYDIEFLSRGKGSSSYFGRFFYYIYSVFFNLWIIFSRNVDIVISFMHPYGVHASWLSGKPSIVFSDTEIAKLHHVMTLPFLTELHTPFTFKKDMGKRHTKFNSFMELAYLNENQFTPDSNILKSLGITENTKFILVRFVSRKSLHDHNHKGISKSDKLKLVSALSKCAKVFISSEIELPPELKSFELTIDKAQIHQALYFANLFVGESGTMVSESALLGTTAIYIDDIGRSYTEYLANKYNMVFQFEENSDGISKTITKAEEYILGEKENQLELRKSIINNYLNTDEYIYDQIQKYQK